MRRSTRSGFENTVSRQKRSAMDKFSRTHGLPITVRIVEENSIVNLFSDLFHKSLFFKKKRNSERRIICLKTGADHLPRSVGVSNVAPRKELVLLSLVPEVDNGCDDEVR